MSVADNYNFYRQRAATERSCAASAGSPEIARLHEQLAEKYEALVAEIEARPPLRLVGSKSPEQQLPLSKIDEPDTSATG